MIKTFFDRLNQNIALIKQKDKITKDRFMGTRTLCVKPMLLDCAKKGITFGDWTRQRTVVTIASIPSELLAAIFKIAYACGARSVTFSCVSRHWRNVTFSLPSLWVNVTISPNWPLSALRASLSRSKALPLNVCFDRLSADVPQTHFDLAMDLIFPHIARWQSLAIHFLPPSLIQCPIFDMPIHALFSRLKDCFAPRLQYFSINGGRNYISDLEAFVEGAPSLTCIHMNEISFAKWSLPMTQITTLHLHGIHHRYDRFLQILEASPLLTNLSLQGSITQSFFPRAIFLPSLRALRYRFPTPMVGGGGMYTYHINCLASILAPALETLWLVNTTDAEIENSLRHTDFSTAFPGLHSLIFQNANVSLATYDKVLATIPFITHFTTSDTQMLEISELLCQRGVHIPWPKLHTITLANSLLGSSDPQCKEGLLFDTLATRMASGHPVTNLRVDKSLLRYSDLRGVQTLVRIEPIETRIMAGMVGLDNECLTTR